MAKTGRPSSYSVEIADEICERMIEGETIAEICRDEAMPSRMTVYRWRDADKSFDTRCARAREGMADDFEARMQAVTEKVEAGTLPPDAARVIVSNLQWRAAKAAPKTFGDAVNLKHSDPDGGPVQINHNDVTERALKMLTDEQLQELTVIDANKNNSGNGAS